MDQHRTAADEPPFRVAVTGLGPITAVGSGVEPFWAGLQRERSGIRAVTRFDASPWRTRIAGEIDEFDAADHMDARTARRLDRFTQFSIASARLAMANAALDTARIDLDRAAVIMGSALGGGAFAEVQAGALYGSVNRGQSAGGWWANQVYWRLA